MGAVLCMNLLTLSGCDRIVQSAVVEEKDQTEQKKEEKKETVQKTVAEQVQAPEKGMVSPYMNHHFVEALLMCGKRDQAMEYMKYYWGGMLSHGADTFWELYNPENPAESPYGSSIVNSYCHAWSCTPTYLLRKYFN